MMYEMVYKTLVEVGLEEAYTPQDYLNFFCLGNREAPDGSPTPAGVNAPQPNTPQVSVLSSLQNCSMAHVPLCLCPRLLVGGLAQENAFVQVLEQSNIEGKGLNLTLVTVSLLPTSKKKATWPEHRLTKLSHS